MEKRARGFAASSCAVSNLLSFVRCNDGDGGGLLMHITRLSIGVCLVADYKEPFHSAHVRNAPIVTPARATVVDAAAGFPPANPFLYRNFRCATRGRKRLVTGD
jgi:hypothetical protein